MSAYFAMSTVVFVCEYEFSSAGLGLIFAFNSIGIVIAAQINACLIRRIALKRVIEWALRASFASLFAVASFFEKSPTPLLFANVFLYLAMIGCVAPNSAAIALTRHSERAGGASAILGTLLFGVGAVSATMSAHVLPGTPVRALMLVMLACSALAMLVFYTTPR